MLSAYLFDARQSERVDDWQGACKGVNAQNLVWLALRDPSDEEIAEVRSALDLSDELAPRLREPPDRASVADDGQHVYVTLVAVAGEAGPLPSGSGSPGWGRGRHICPQPRTRQARDVSKSALSKRAMAHPGSRPEASPSRPACLERSRRVPRSLLKGAPELRGRDTSENGLAERSAPIRTSKNAA